MTLNALCDTDTNKTIHRDHQFIVVPDPSWAACDGVLTGTNAFADEPGVWSTGKIERKFGSVTFSIQIGRIHRSCLSTGGKQQHS
jgi:hypothetical protein